MGPAISTAGFRILQEALTNIARHANASRVVVRLVSRSNELRLEVRDNGQGIQPQRLANVGSLGLLGMRERALGLGGTVEVLPAKPKGTLVKAHLPLNSPHEEEFNA
jgi:signal transduction histidine kinase